LGTTGDYLIADGTLRLFVSRGGGSVNFAELDGGTGLDVATWDGEDHIDEVIPIVSGGWIDVESVTPGAEGVTVLGTLRAIPHLDPPENAGAMAEVTWSVQDGSVRVDGASALWVRALDGAWFDGSLLLHQGWAVSGEGSAQDLGGAVVFGGNTLHVERADAAWQRRFPAGALAEGTADGAALEIVNSEGVLAVVPLAEPGFSLRMPPGARGLRTVRPGHAPGAERPPSSAMNLKAGPSGAIEVSLFYADRVRSVEARWTGASGSGAEVIHGDRATLATGPGSVEVFLDGLRYTVAVPENGKADLDHVATEVVPPPWVRVGFSVTAPDWSSRQTPAEIAALASTRDQRLTVLWARGRVPRADATSVRAALAATTAEGHFVISWPWTVLPRRAGQGAVVLDGRSLPDVLAAAGGERRIVAVPVEALGDLGFPWEVDPVPSLVFVNEPVVPPDEWRKLGDWWSAGRALVPHGPVTWAWVPGDDPSPVAVEQAWLRGRVSAGSGLPLTLDVAGAHPGDVLTSDVIWPVPLRARVSGAEGAANVAVWTDQGWIVVDSDGVIPLPAATRWAAAVAWTPGGGPWAITGPVWLQSP
jgi:hypothetical protein